MSPSNIYNSTKILYLLTYVHNFFCFAQLVLNVTIFTTILFIIFPYLSIYGSLYYIEKNILGIITLTKAIVGIILVFIGLIAGWKRSYVYLTLYGSTMFLIFLLDISLIIIYITFTKFDTFNIYSEKQLIHHFNLLRNENSRSLIDDIQQQLQCCGINGPEDYKSGTTVNVPVSCCPNKDCKNILSIYLTGCLKSFLNNSVPGLVFINTLFLTLFITEVLSMSTTIKYVLKIIDFPKTNVLQSL